MSKRIKFNPKSKTVKEQWLKAYEGIKTYRKVKDPVAYTQPREKKTEIQKYASLTGLMLSALTKDEQTWAAVQKLKAHGLTVENIRNTSEEQVKELIHGVGFHNTKARHIKQVAEILHEKYEGLVPTNYKEVIKLPGVGPKMAILYIQSATGEVRGIAVDVHVHRISNRLGWANSKTPEGTRAQIEKLIPEDMWHRVNYDVVTFGKKVWFAIKPACYECKIAKYCPFPKKTKRPAPK